VSQHIENVVLVHGAFADGSGWKRVADILKHDGYKVSVVQHPETSYADDQKYTKAAIDAMGGPVTATVDLLSPRPAIIRTLQRWFILPLLRSMKVRAVRRSKRLCRKPPRRSTLTATGFGGLTKRISWLTSHRTSHEMRQSSWL